MAQFNLPDGQKLNVPDNLDPSTREELAGAVKRIYDIDINETTPLGQARESLKAIPRGLISSIQDIPIGISSAFDIGNDSGLTKLLKTQQERTRTEGMFAPDPAYESTFLTKVGLGLGSFIPYLSAAGLGRAALARGIGAKAPALLQPTFSFPASLAVPSGIATQSDLMDQARELGEDVGPIAEVFSEIAGGGIGVSELFPILNLLKRVPKNALNYPEVRSMLQSAAITGTEEAIQESVSGITQNLVARGLYSDKLPILDSAWDDLTVGGAVGFLADLAVNSVSRRSRGRDYLRDQEDRARKNKFDLNADSKFERGIAQGELQEVQDEPVRTKLEIPKIPALVVAAPSLEVIQNPDGKFSLVDIATAQTPAEVDQEQAQEIKSPVIEVFETEKDALEAKNKLQTNYLRRRLKVDIDNAIYSMGMPDSASASELGESIFDPNIAELNIKSLIEFDKTLSTAKKKIFTAESKAAGWWGVQVPKEMIERKKSFLKETSKYLKSKGLELKASYTMPEVKQVLTRKDYNILLNDRAAIVFQASEKDSEPSIIADKDGQKPNVNLKYIKDIAASKNIDLDFKDPAVKFAAKQWTGTDNISRANRSVKELFLARIHSLTPFNSRTKFPDFRPRQYTAQDVANFVSSMGSRNVKFTVNDLKKAGVTAKNNTATEQFIRDLVDSGRAEKIEGTSQYQIRKNHEFDIARRAEGFNETPAEFGDRLRQEGKLKEETILQLVEQETKRQEKVLPPEEIEPKIIKFREAVEEGRTNVFARELRKILDQRGLKETGVVVSNDILSTTALASTPEGIVFDPRPLRKTETEGAVLGEYDRNTDIIFLSLNAINPDGTATVDQIRDSLNKVLDHEIIHAFREKDLITEREYQYLRKEVKRKKVPALFDENFKGRTFYQRAVKQNEGRPDLQGQRQELKEETYVEEAIAEMYRARHFKPDIAPKADGILNNIVQFFKSMGQAMRTAGYKRASEVFKDIEAGRVGGRQRGEIRTLRELDRLAPEAVDAPVIQEFEEGEVPPAGEPTDVITIGQSGAIATPVKAFEDIEADTADIRGAVIKPSGFETTGKIFDKREQTEEQLKSQKAAILKEFGYQHRNSIDVLTWLAKNAPSKDYRVISERLLDQIKKLKRLKKIDFQFRIIRSGSDRLDFPGHKGGKLGYMGVSYGPFMYKDGPGAEPGSLYRQQIYISDIGQSQGVDFETILHEFVHQATQAATISIGADLAVGENVNALERIRKRVKQVINEKKEAGEEIDYYVGYGTKNIQELMAVGFTDRVFQKFMEEIPYHPKGKKSLWDKFTETIRKLLGIPAKQGSVFSEFLSQAGKITSLSQKQIKTFLGGKETLGGVNYMPARRPSPEQQQIQERINEIDVKLMPLESTMYKESGKMGKSNYNKLQKQIDDLEFQKRKLKQQLVEEEKKTAAPVDDIDVQIPLFSRAARFADDKNTNENIKLREATEKAVEIVRKTPRGEVPFYNVNASDVALEAAIDFNEDAAAKAPDDIPKFSRAPLPGFIKPIADRIGEPEYESTKSFGARLIDVASNPVSNIRKAFKKFRTAVIDKLDPAVQRVMEFSQQDEETLLLNNAAETSGIVALRLADRARGVFQQMLLTGYPTGQIEGVDSLTNVEKLPIDTKYNPFIDGDTGFGGLMQITAPLFSDPSVDLEGVFAVYAKLKRQKSLNDQQKEIASPITSQDIEAIGEIEVRFPQVVEVYNNYQKWNNQLITFAQKKGLLSDEQSDLWREHSSYYPFYRDMVDEGDIIAPKIGGGMLPNNPLNITMKGSEEKITVPPLEAIARNSLSILTAAMKNDGAAKLMRDFVKNEMAEEVNAKQASGKLTIPVFENGRKKLYLVDDIEVYEALRGIGGVNTDFITKILQFPAGILRDTVTRDPGFIMVNLFRDTLSAAVTAGNIGLGEGNFTPIVDTIKGMMGDITDLERFGIVGGYDYANDEGSVVDLMARARRREGLTADNGITAQDAFYKLWDGLGGLTTKSDGATRMGVYKAVYNDMKARGASEASAQSEAAYQALEIINFGRRGNSVLFRYITSAIPFLNARIQGLDVLWRSASGQYSAIEKQREGETLKDVQGRIQRGFLTRGGLLMGITAMYYALVSDTDEYKEVKREVRDDNWLVPTPFDYTIKLPIPFEVGMIFKAIPERLIDEFLGREIEKDPLKSIKRQLGTSADIPFIGGDIGIQAVKPIFEAAINRNSWTNTEIVPYYKQKEMPAYQARQSTNEVARLIGEMLNISPMKIEHVLQGYTGTLGGYLLNLMDVTARSITGTPLMPPNVNNIPLIKRFLIDNDKGGGLQQSFYELREEVQGAVATLNDLRDQKRMDELAAFREHNKGLFQAKGQVNAINRFMQNWRKRRDRLLRRTDLSAMVKADMLKELEIRRDKRLAIVPALRQKADVPRISLGN